MEEDKAKAALKEEECEVLLQKQDQPRTSKQAEETLETSWEEDSEGSLDLNPFPEEDEPHKTTHFTKSSVQTETVSEVTTEEYVPAPAKKTSTSSSKLKAAKKVPKKVINKSRPRPGTGSLNYIPSEEDF